MRSSDYVRLYRNFLVSTILLMAVVSISYAQNAHQLRRQGDKEYNKGSYSESEEKYRKSLEIDPRTQAHFNLGNSLYNQQRYEEAIEQYDKVISGSREPDIRSKAYFNKGNAYFNEQKLDQSIESYKESLRLNPEDEAARKNLYLARQLLQQQQQQQQPNKDQRDQDQSQSQQQDETTPSGEETAPQNQDKDQDTQEGQNQPENEQMNADSSKIDSLVQQQITREELMRLLKVIEDEDRQIQQKLRKGSGEKKKSEKDW